MCFDEREMICRLSSAPFGPICRFQLVDAAQIRVGVQRGEIVIARARISNEVGLPKLFRNQNGMPTFGHVQLQKSAPARGRLPYSFKATVLGPHKMMWLILPCVARSFRASGANRR